MQCIRRDEVPIGSVVLQTRERETETKKMRLSDEIWQTGKTKNSSKACQRFLLGFLWWLTIYQKTVSLTRSLFQVWLMPSAYLFHICGWNERIKFKIKEFKVTTQKKSSGLKGRNIREEGMSPSHQLVMSHNKNILQIQAKLFSRRI